MRHTREKDQRSTHKHSVSMRIKLKIEVQHELTACKGLRETRTPAVLCQSID